jgi:hypothetical protein
MRYIFIALLAILLCAADASACSVCMPGCVDYGYGRPNCMSSATFCRIWGEECQAGPGGCICGTVGCSPCDPTCGEPEPQWQLAAVEVRQREQPAPQWTLVAVRTESNRS